MLSINSYFWHFNCNSNLSTTMKATQAGIPGVSVYLDDIIVGGRTTSWEHAARLEKMLCRLNIAGLRSRNEKCRFVPHEVLLLMRRIDPSGLHPTQDKVEAIVNILKLANKGNFKGVTELVAFYDIFLKDKETLTVNLYKFLKKNTPTRTKMSYGFL